MNKSPAGLYSPYDMTLETTYDETTALREAQQGSRAAFGALVTLYQKRAYAIAYGFVRNRDDALDLAQESFVKAYRSIGRFDTQRPFYPWLYRIVKNTCLNHIKKKRRRGETSLDGLRESGVEFPSTTRGPAGKAALSELRSGIGVALESLGEDHREIIVLRHIHEHSYKEIADVLSIPQGTVMSRLHAARKSLRDALEQSPVQKHESEA